MNPTPARHALKRILDAARDCAVCLPRCVRQALGRACRALPQRPSEDESRVLLRGILEATGTLTIAEAPVEWFHALNDAERLLSITAEKGD